MTHWWLRSERVYNASGSSSSSSHVDRGLSNNSSMVLGEHKNRGRSRSLRARKVELLAVCKIFLPQQDLICSKVKQQLDIDANARFDVQIGDVKVAICNDDQQALQILSHRCMHQFNDMKNYAVICVQPTRCSIESLNFLFYWIMFMDRDGNRQVAASTKSTNDALVFQSVKAIIDSFVQKQTENMFQQSSALMPKQIKRLKLDFSSHPALQTKSRCSIGQIVKWLPAMDDQTINIADLKRRLQILQNSDETINDYTSNVDVKAQQIKDAQSDEPLNFQPSPSDKPPRVTKIAMMSLKQLKIATLTSHKNAFHTRGRANSAKSSAIAVETLKMMSALDEHEYIQFPTSPSIEDIVRQVKSLPESPSSGFANHAVTEELAQDSSYIVSGIQVAMNMQMNGLTQEAFRLYCSAALVDNSVGLFLCGMSLRHGWGCLANYELAYACLLQAYLSAKAVFIQSILNAQSKSVQVINHTSNRNTLHSQLANILFELGQVYRFGWGREQSDGNAALFYKLSADLGDVNGMQEYAILCLQGFKNTKPNKQLASAYIRLAQSTVNNNQCSMSWLQKPRYNDFYVNFFCKNDDKPVY